MSRGFRSRVVPPQVLRSNPSCSPWEPLLAARAGQLMLGDLRNTALTFFAMMLAVGLLAWGQELRPPAQLERRYDQGPLRAEEFRGLPKLRLSEEKGRPLDAYTMTRIRFRYQYNVWRRRGRSIVRLKSIEVYSVFDRDKSWNRRPQDAELLDHEQGHFDITETHARRAQLELNRLGRTAATRTAAATEKGAVEQLNARIREQLKPFVEANVKAHADYDRLTAHGGRRQAQAVQRQQQRDQLREFADLLELEKAQRRMKRRDDR